MDNTLKRDDPIRDEYYAPLEQSEKCSNVLFYLTLCLSFTILYVNKISNPIIYEAVHIFFIASIIGLFIVDNVIAFYLKPRAEDKRLQDFLSSAYGVRLNHKRTTGYYNNHETLPLKRIGLQLLENCYFSKSILSKMVRKERIRNSIYIFAWLLMALYRQSDLGLIAFGAQLLFGEYIIYRWISLEWLRGKVENIYDTVYRRFQQNTMDVNFDIVVQECFVKYECIKSKSGIIFSKSIFDGLNEELSAEWNDIIEQIQINNSG